MIGGKAIESVATKQPFFISSPLLWNHDFETIFQKASKHHMGLEIFHQQVAFHQVQPERIKRLVEKYQLDVFVHAYSWDLNLSSLQEPLREAALEQTKQSIMFAGLIGAQDVTIHPGRMSIALESDIYLEHMHDAMAQLLAFAETKRVSISFEIMGPIGKELVTDRFILEKIAKDYWQTLPVTLDLAHCQDEAMIIDHIENIPNLVKLHISNHKLGTYHTALDDGELDFKRLKPIIQKTGLPVVVEGMEQGLENKLWNRNLRYLMEENYI